MITLRKLSSLPGGTRTRKTVSLVKDLEGLLAGGGSPDWAYWDGVFRLVSDDAAWPDGIRAASAGLAASPRCAGRLRAVHSLRHAMLSFLGRDWADWDMANPGDEGRGGPAGSSREGVFPARVYLDGLRSPFNVGSVFRTALAFGVERLWTSPDGAPPDHSRAKRSAMGALERVPWEVRGLEELSGEDTGPLFALELGGIDVGEFVFPEEGTVILGSEELGVSPGALGRAAASAGTVSIPLPGPKASLNVGVAFGILMQAWSGTLRAAETRHRPPPEPGI